MRRIFSISTAVISWALATACGAPTKNASDVAYLFEAPSRTLQDKVGGVCKTLQERQTPPSTAGLDINLNGCADAGLAALDYRDLTAFRFLGIEDEAATKEEVIRKTVRTEFWLNKSLLGFASAISSKLGSADNQAGLLSSPDSGKQISNLVKTSIEQLEPFVFDQENFEVSALIGLKASGVATVDNRIRVSGKLIDNVFALVIQTAEDQPKAKSLIKKFSGLILIVPHASDIYLDMYLDIQVHNIGLPSIFRQVISGILSDQMKTVADGLLAL